MLSPTHRLVVLGLIGCLVSLEAAAQDPLGSARPVFDSVHDFDRSPCPHFDGPGEPVSLIGLTEDVDPSHAPIPTNDSERLLFRQVYETLVQADCDFTGHPALAAAWQVDPTGMSWIITLRREARFTDGTPVTARDVIASWNRGGITLHPDVARFIRSATALDDLTLSVALRHQQPHGQGEPAFPRDLAQPALAIARFAPDSPWPLGTRGMRLDAPAFSAGRATIALMPASPVAPAGTSPGPRTGGDVVGFLVAPNRDARDLLDQGVDLLLTRDPATLAYANVLAQFDSIPLPWLRSYVFISREAAPDATLAPALRQELADDAVAGEAQGSSYGWLTAADGCTMQPAGPGGKPSLPKPEAVAPARIAYDRTDPVARSLAERLAALASARPPDGNGILDALIPQSRSRTLQMDPLREADLRSALARGADAGFVIALDRSTGCAGVTMLQERAPWLTPRAVVPIVDTRLRAIVRRGRSHMTMEWDGSLLVSGPLRRQ